MLEEKKPVVPESNLLQLRKKVENLSPQQGFRRKVIGGISEEDVQEFVKSLYEQAQKNEEIYKKKIEDLTSYGETLSGRLESDKSELEKLKESAGYLQYLNTKMETDMKKLRKDLEQSRLNLAEVRKLKNNDKEQAELADSYKKEVKRLEDEVCQLIIDKEEMVRRVSDLEEEINLSRSQLAERGENGGAQAGNNFGGDKELALTMLEDKVAMLEGQLEESHKKFKREQINTARMSEENANLKARIDQLRDETYKQLEVLAEQLKERGQMEDQLSNERIRANNVENDMSELVEMVLNLRNKFQNEQRQLDDKLSMVKKKHFEEEDGYQYVEQIMQQTTQDLENIFLSAQNNVNSILNNANEKVQEMSKYYQVFKSDIIDLHSNLESHQGKTSEWIEALYSSIEKSHGLDEIKDSETD